MSTVDHSYTFLICFVVQLDTAAHKARFIFLELPVKSFSWPVAAVAAPASEELIVSIGARVSRRRYAAKMSQFLECENLALWQLHL